MSIKTKAIVKTLMEHNDSDKLIAASRQLLGSEAVQYAINVLWVNYARLEVDVLKGPREDRNDVADLVRNKRLALDDLIDELEGISNQQLSEEGEQSPAEEQ